VAGASRKEFFVSNVAECWLVTGKKYMHFVGNNF
jgi:hypothetical protein